MELSLHCCWLRKLREGGNLLLLEGKAFSGNGKGSLCLELGVQAHLGRAGVDPSGNSVWGDGNVLQSLGGVQGSVGATALSIPHLQGLPCTGTLPNSSPSQRGLEQLCEKSRIKTNLQTAFRCPQNSSMAFLISFNLTGMLIPEPFHPTKSTCRAEQWRWKDMCKGKGGKGAGGKCRAALPTLQLHAEKLFQVLSQQTLITAQWIEGEGPDHSRE